MKTVLVADDDRVILTTLVGFLGRYSEDLKLVTAENGVQALEVLEREPVDLLVTDLYMPEMDGFELLAHMMRHFAQVPIIVMSGYEVPEMGSEIARKGALHYLEKPFDFQSLADTVRRTLASTSKGHLAGISLLGFLQLLNFEKKSCSLTVRSDGRLGRIHVVEGELVNADRGRLQGESAVFEILAWEDCQIEISAPQRVERLIQRPLHGVILEAAKELDESSAPPGGVPPGGAPQNGDHETATVPIAIDQGPLDAERSAALSALFKELELPASGAIGLALVDVQQSEVLAHHCYQYWPDFEERVAVATPAIRRRLELDDGEQVEEVLTTLEALLEIWRPLGDGRRMVFYLLTNRQHGGLETARGELEALAPRVRRLFESGAAAAS